jgi:hypothetical protein
MVERISFPISEGIGFQDKCHFLVSPGTQSKRTRRLLASAEPENGVFE